MHIPFRRPTAHPAYRADRPQLPEEVTSWRRPGNRSGSRFASCGPITSSGPASTSSPPSPGRPTPTPPPARLLTNQEDIGAAVAGFYGQAAGDRLTELLKEHILIAVDLVAAAKSGDQAAFATHDARWTANIETIAAFLAGANPNWPEKDVLDLLALHLKLTKDEAVARITGDWAADVKAFDDIFTEIMVLADALHDGIVAQFPERFAAMATA